MSVTTKQNFRKNTLIYEFQIDQLKSTLTYLEGLISSAF